MRKAKIHNSDFRTGAQAPDGSVRRPCDGYEKSYRENRRPWPKNNVNIYEITIDIK